VIGLQAYAIILPVDLYNLVIGLCLCNTCYDYFSFWFAQWVLMPSEQWYGSVAEDVNMIWFSVRRLLPIEILALRDEEVVILTLPCRDVEDCHLWPHAVVWVSADCFVCLLVKLFNLCMCFFKENLKRWIVCFLLLDSHTKKKIINYLAVWHRLIAYIPH